MIKGIIGKKLGMTQVFAANGTRIPVTVIEAGPCTVLQKKTDATDGYNALQLGFMTKSAHRTNKPEMGLFRKVAKGAFTHLKELQAENVDNYQVGDEISCDAVLSAGDIIDVTGTSTGKGFQGVIKRWGFSGGRATHGSRFHRSTGSIGQSAWPAKVFKGKKMAGQMGNKRATTQNLEVVAVRADENIILVKGAVPGATNSVVLIQQAVKAVAK
jgi:large subunit ribosomal protein L3